MADPSSNPSNVNTNMPNTSSATRQKRNSGDVGWEYGETVDENNLDRVRCKKCGHTFGGGVYRLKQHVGQIVGNVKICPNPTPEAKRICREALANTKRKKEKKEENIETLREEVVVGGTGIEQVKQVPIEYGAFDRFVEVNPVDPSKFTRQPKVTHLLDKQRLHDTQQYVARWVYESGIPFNAINNNSFIQMMEAVGQYGPGFKPPSQYQLREPCLLQEVQNVKGALKKCEDEWARTGCSIMTDAWSDRKRRSVMNLCVHCKEGTCFYDSKEVSDESHMAAYILDYVDKCIENIGPKNVVQVVTDNASNNMAAAGLMLAKRPTMFWTSCATHTVNLALEGIGKIPKYKNVVDKAKALTIYIYSHHKTLSLMRKYTKKRDIVRPGITRFASSFLSLQSLFEKKEQLRLMATSQEWIDCVHSKTVKGKAASNTMLSVSFWRGVTMCLGIFTPLVRVLRVVDGDRPSMPWLHGEFEAAKKELVERVFKGEEKYYKPVLDIIDDKCNGRLNGDLHLVAFILNPYYLYRFSDREEVAGQEKYVEAMLTCVSKFFPDEEEVQTKVLEVELLKYKNKEGLFGKKAAENSLEFNDFHTFNPVGWCSTYGAGTSNLRKMAVRILSLSTSASGCERNWSAFEGIHTKKRNRLDSMRLKNLVYVQFNARFLNKMKVNETASDVLLAHDGDSSKAQHWLVEGLDDNYEIDGDVVAEGMEEDESELPRRSTRLRNAREIHDDEFDSSPSDVEVYEDEFDFESDEESNVPISLDDVVHDGDEF